MKKKLFSFLVLTLVLVSCKNYDDEFDVLNASIASLQSQVTSLSTLQSNLSNIQNTINSLQTTLDGRGVDLSAILIEITSLQTDLNALTADFSEADLAALQENLDLLQADVDEILESQNVDSLILNLSGLDELGVDFVYEGWLIVNGSPVSTGTFSSVSFPQSFTVNKSDLELAVKFVLTIEPAVDSDPAPSATKYLVGDFSGDTAAITTGIVGDFNSSWGKAFLRTPTDEVPGSANNGNDENGIWFGTPGAPPTAGLGLPELPEGWKYEGWVVVEGLGPVTTGTFTSLTTADDSNAFSGTENNAGPPVPGEDFFLNAPTGFTFPLDVRGRTAVISIEPYPDNSPAPFTMKPLVGAVGQEIAPATHNLGLNLASFPTGIVSR